MKDNLYIYEEKFIAHGLKWLNRTIKYKIKLWLKIALENKVLDKNKLIPGLVKLIYLYHLMNNYLLKI